MLETFGTFIETHIAVIVVINVVWTFLLGYGTKFAINHIASIIDRTTSRVDAIEERLGIRD